MFRTRLMGMALPSSVLAAVLSLPACGDGEAASLTTVETDAGFDAIEDVSQPGDAQPEAALEAGPEAALEGGPEAAAEAAPDTSPPDADACDGCAGCTPGARSCQGNVVMQCKADGLGTEVVETCADPKLCHEGTCAEACAVAAAFHSNAGCEFWAADLDQQDAMNDPATPPIGVFVANPGSGPAVVKVEINAAAPGVPVQPSVVAETTIAAGSSHTFSLPSRELDCGAKANDYASPGTCLSSKAFRITSTRPVTAVQFNTAQVQYSNDASLLLPTHVLGKSYRALGWPAGHAIMVQGFNILDRSYLTIVGTTANTQITVAPTWRIKGNPPVSATLPGGKIVLTIGPFDVLNLETDDGTIEDLPSTISDLSGTSIEATAPVAVFSGVESAGAPNGVIDIPTPPAWTEDQTCCLDHLEDLMLPATMIGASYAATRSPSRSTGSFREPDIIRFVGVSNNTQVTTSLPAPFDSFVLQAGEVKTTWTQDNVVVSASAPVVLGQIIVSNQYTESNLGDPSLSLFVPIDQFRSSHDILSPAGYTRNWAVVTEEAGTAVKVDGQSSAACAVEPVGDVGGKSWQSRRCELTAGAHRITADRPIGVMVYGYSSAASYSYVAGVGALPPTL